MSSAYERAVELATEVGEPGRMASPLKRAEKIALAQVWANLAVAEALAANTEKGPGTGTSTSAHGFS